MKKIPTIYLIPATISAIFCLVLALGWSQAFENRIYDIFLGWKPGLPTNKDIVFVKVDDPAVSTVGTWPISRSITADGLLLLKEMGAEYAIFDIEYLNKSPRGVDASVLEETYPALLSQGISQLAENNTGLVEALRLRRIALSEASAFARDFHEVADATKDHLVTELQRIAIDNDQRLARAVEVFGKAFLTVNVQAEVDPTVDPGIKATAVSRFSLPQTGGLTLLAANEEISPTIDPILSASKGIGFTNVEVDADGVRRRVDLLKRYGDTAFAQLAFAPFLDFVGRPTLEVRPDAVLIRGAHYPDGTTSDVRVPRAQDGSVLINWPRTPFLETFRHLSFYFVYTHDRLYDDLVHNLQARSSWGYLDLYQGENPLVDQAQTLARLRQDLLSGEAPAEAIADYRAGRDAFLAEVGAYLATKPDENLLGQLAEVLGHPDLPADQRGEYQTIQADLPDWFAKTRTVYENLMEMRTDPKKLGALQGTFCIIGNTNTGSTDLGVTPFEKGFPNVGTHAAVLNMLLQKNFVTDASPWISWVLGVLGALGLTLFLREKKPVMALSLGGGISVAAIVAFALFFSFTGVYLPVVPMATIVVLSFLGTTFFQFLNTEKEKGFLRNAFSRYLSNEVIQQIIANPDQLRLGGQQKVMTAMFTDIRGFSTISEKMTPEELVFLLNQYLTSMSDIILDLQGTIDKYEGDAIIAFFGAPIDLDDHARRACLAAVRMKRVEDELNVRFLGEELAPSPLLTRIGINTGPMVVGNMGTTRKMDYTIIGDSVNLAARLEGVNKLYGTWILISEDTKNLVGDLIVTRKLDRVRVVGKSVPIRLYQAVEERGHLPPGMEKLLERYHDALEHFEQRRWTQAREGFDECLRLFPEDGPSIRYRKLASDYEATPPPEAWDGVFKMDTK